ncbi:MAG: alpha/beta fold hydrolase [Acidimicrobiales bacterium]
MLRTFAGGHLFGTRTGTASPVVLALHGWARTHRDFDAVLAPPGRPPVDAVAVDLPGFGATPPPDVAWGSPAYAEVVAEVVAEMAGPVVVVGHSFGGRVAVHLAAARPDLVRALVLTGVPLLRTRPASRPARRFRAVRALHRAGLVGEERMEGARRRFGSADYAAAQGTMRAVLVETAGESYEQQLDAIGCPVALVWGDDDATVPVAVAEAVAGRLRDARLTVLPGAGHLVPLTAPDALRAVVERCLG